MDLSAFGMLTGWRDWFARAIAQAVFRSGMFRTKTLVFAREVSEDVVIVITRAAGIHQVRIVRTLGGQIGRAHV